MATFTAEHRATHADIFEERGFEEAMKYVAGQKWDSISFMFAENYATITFSGCDRTVKLGTKED